MRMVKKHLLKFIVEEFTINQKERLVKEYGLGETLISMKEIENLPMTRIELVKTILCGYEYPCSQDPFQVNADYFFWEKEYGNIVSLTYFSEPEYYNDMIYRDLDFKSVSELLGIIEYYKGLDREDLEDELNEKER